MILAGTVLAAENTNPLIPAWGEVVVGVIAFGLLCYVLMTKAFPQIEKVYEERRDKIEGGLERAEKAQQEAQETLEQYRAQLAEARADANKIREDARVQGRQIIEELRADAQREAADLRARAESQLAAEREQAVASLRREVGQIAVELATRIVGHELTGDERQRELVDDFVGGLESAGTAPTSSSAGAGA